MEVHAYVSLKLLLTNVYKKFIKFFKNIRRIGFYLCKAKEDNQDLLKIMDHDGCPIEIS